VARELAVSKYFDYFDADETFFVLLHFSLAFSREFCESVSAWRSSNIVVGQEAVAFQVLLAPSGFFHCEVESV
jgi:hypothetical protein